MKTILNKSVADYMDKLLPRRDPILRQMERYAAAHRVPIVGPACGRVLHQLARLIKARRVFELGSAIGYSTLWLARAVGPDGTVFYTDSDPANADRAQAYLNSAGLLSSVQILVGDALEMLDRTEGEFDLIFNDVNKTGYPEVFRRALPRLRVGGLFITDNVLWSGKVAGKARQNDANTRAIQRFNKLIYSSPELFTTVIPLRDGLAVCEKLGERPESVK
jgi:predicted O-methyltransferase YrrM